MLTPFGKELRKVRIDRGLLLKDMADRLELSSAFMSAVETGRKEIPRDLLERIIDAYELTTDEVERLSHAAVMTARVQKIRLPSNASDASREVAAMLARRFPTLTDEQTREIREILERRRA
jgi:transcriptional regulator with XRE-family HTH domain